VNIASAVPFWVPILLPSWPEGSIVDFILSNFTVAQPWDYISSKVGDLLITWEAAERLGNRGVFINAVHPGDTGEDREAFCCAMNVAINRANKGTLLEEEVSCCDSDHEAAVRPTWLARHAPAENLHGSWWIKQYQMQPLYASYVHARKRLWSLCEQGPWR